ncbi:MAG: M4 family peptidase, partial [Nocardioidaceae bacterium]|nr:M4 family peptidase [Nocardioidaceae bacterium]
KAWRDVGVTPGASGGGGAHAPQRSGTVAVTRSGGFAGVTQTGEATLGDDPRTPEIESLLDRIDFRGLAPHQPMPDRFVYTFDIQGEQVTVGEHELTPDLQQLALLVLGTR